jgi:hydroxyacylglutathione hydrolase
MKKLLFSIIILVAMLQSAMAQMPSSQIDGKVVFQNNDVIFHQIDENTWVGTGHMMANESIYLIAGKSKALLIDAGTDIKDLDKIVGGITKLPVMLVATHVHPDHTGSAINSFPEIYINADDTVNMAQFMPNHKCKVKYLSDKQVIDLGGRTIEVIFTPAHTPGSTTFIDKKAGYGFSGDSFGSGNLLLTGTFSTLIESCRKMSTIMKENNIKQLYPGHFFGKNAETQKRIDDLATISEEVLSGKRKGTENKNAMLGLNLSVNEFGVTIRYSDKSIK